MINDHWTVVGVSGSILGTFCTNPFFVFLIKRTQRSESNLLYFYDLRL